MRPNAIIVKVDGMFQLFPMLWDGTLTNPSIPFSSPTLQLDETQVMFSSYNQKDSTNTELTVYTLMKDGVEVTAIEVMRDKNLITFTKCVMSEYNKNGENFDGLTGV